MNFLIKLLVFLLCLFSLECENQTSKYTSEDSKWLIENEVKIDTELNKIFSEKRMEKLKIPFWQSSSFVVTQFDTTILGDFAKRIKKINRCFDVMYTYSRKMENRKRITIIRDLSGQCLDMTTVLFSLIDSTQYLKISFDTLPSRLVQE